MDAYLNKKKGGYYYQKKKSVNYKISEEEEEEIKESFSLFDSDKDGKIDKHEFKICLRSLGFIVKKEEIDYFYNLYDKERSGQLEYKQFFEIMKEKYSERDPMDEIKKAFHLFDSDKTGKISLSNLEKIAKDIGENISQDELIAMIDEFDKTNDHQITEKEWIDIMTDDSL